MQVTDEMVEAGCQGRTAAVNLKPGTSFKWPDDFGEPYLQEVRASTRAALEAVLPMIRDEVLEEAARIAEGWPVEAAGNDYQTNGNGRFWDAGTNYHQSRMDAAAAIRAMKGTSHE